MLGCLQTGLWEAWRPLCVAVSTVGVWRKPTCAAPGALGKLVLTCSLSWRGEHCLAGPLHLELSSASVGMGDAGRVKLLFLAYAGLYSGFLLLKFLKEDARALPEPSVFMDPCLFVDV